MPSFIKGACTAAEMNGMLLRQLKAGSLDERGPPLHSAKERDPVSCFLHLSIGEEITAVDYRTVQEALNYGDRQLAGAPGGVQAALFAEALDAGKWQELRQEEYYKPQLEAIRQEGDRLLGEPVEALPFSLYRIYDTDGLRQPFERPYFARRRRLNLYAFLTLLDEDARYLAALEDIIWTLCDEYAWSLPAHLGGQSLSWPQAGEQQHRQVIDLFAAETAFALAEVLHLLGDRLSPVVKGRARHEVLERVLKPYAGLGPALHWETSQMNWASVCGGSIGAAALYLFEDAATLSPLLYRILGTLDSYLSGFEPDGACVEGIGYWGYGFGFYVYFAELLKQRTAGQLDLMQQGKVQAIALFHEKAYLSGCSTVPFSDAVRTVRYPLGLLHQLKRRYSRLHVPPAGGRIDLLQEPVARWAPFIRELIWSDPRCQGTPWPTCSYLLPDAGWFISRVWPGEEAAMSSMSSVPSVTAPSAFAAKGGHNDEPHNHNDLGSFVYHIGGETLLEDLGAGEYTKAYFGAGRYDLLCNGSQGHSVPIVNGSVQQAGRERRAQVLCVEQTAGLDRFGVELSSAYNEPALLGLERRWEWDKRRLALKLEDRFLLRESGIIITERLMSGFEPKLQADGSVLIRGLQQGLRIRCQTHAHIQVTVEPYRFMDHQQCERQIYALDLTWTAAALEETMAIIIEAITGEEL
ncbi:heparinase II/III family protein [Paenibacillus sp. SYP-B4298]|uniref:heparinase II/III family protein n=1 Tax=Paenibacillus sp. SYP-B4298 TaxID=2996034 RepID=UPI0022DDF75A|nr:heparinase II/III family protein [Paenibacillus sp. SYP-B4298]